MKCKMCGTSYVPGEEKFCEGCGVELPTAPMSTPAQKSAPALDSDDIAPASSTGPSNTVGRNSIQSSSNNTTTSNSNNISNHTVNNTTTTIEDDTKKSIVCAVSGKRVLYIESVCCRGCDKDVSLEYYNENTRRCENCHQGYLQQYKEAYRIALESNGGIDRQERAELNILSQQLFLTEEEKSKIETELRDLKSSEIENEASGFDDLFDMELSIVKQEIFKKNNLSSALIRLGDLFKQVQTNDEISCFYFMIKAIMSPGQYITNYESASYDEFWENYWLFIPYLRKGDHVKVMKSFRDNYAKFSHKKNEIYLSETVYLMMRFQTDQTDMLIENSTNKLALIESISGNLLTKLYKSNSQLLETFDYGLSKFADLTPPNEPGMKEYHLFFLNHLYKIVPEAPKVEMKTVVEPSLPVAPQEATRPVAPQELARPVAPQEAVTSEPKQFPKLPNLPGGANRMPTFTQGPKIPAPTQESKQTNNNPNNAFKLPPLPKAPATPAKPQIPVPQNKVPVPTPKVPSRPPVPPMPGKK